MTPGKVRGPTTPVKSRATPTTKKATPADKKATPKTSKVVYFRIKSFKKWQVSGLTFYVKSFGFCVLLPKAWIGGHQFFCEKGYRLSQASNNPYGV